MPLPIIVFGVAAKAAADVAAWTTGQVVAIGAATASTGGLTAGVIYSA